MEPNIELQQVIYSILKIQIQFGVYQHGDRLPTIKEACRIFQVSTRSIRAAYQNLQKEGFITISQKVGVKVKVQYSATENERYVQSFFSCRKDALIDLSRSMQPLFSKAQWLGFQNASPELLDNMEQFIQIKGIHPSNRMIQHLQQVYGSLHNDMLMRLVWQVLMFYQAPFMSIKETAEITHPKENPLLRMIGLCREKNWTQLQEDVETFQAQMATVLDGFYETRACLPPAEQQIDFYWSGYRKTSQKCYSLVIELLTDVVRGTYPVGAFLPSAEKLAKEKNVSVSTIRRTLSMLNCIGAMKSINGIGTQVLPPEQIAQCCDFTQPFIRSRLLDYVQSLQTLTLSCKEVAQITIASINRTTAELFKKRLCALRYLQHYELTGYGVLDLLSYFAPYKTIRTVYTELFQQLLWGYPLKSIHKKQDVMETFYLPCLNYLLDCLGRCDAAGFAAKLEEFMLYELDNVAELLNEVGFKESETPFLSKR